MKSELDVVKELRGKLFSGTSRLGIWADEGAGRPYPLKVNLGVTRETLKKSSIIEQSVWREEMKELAEAHGCSLEYENRAIAPNLPSTREPVRLVVPDERAAASFAGAVCISEIEKRNARREKYSSYGFDPAIRDEIIRKSRNHSNTEFDLILQCADWARGKDFSDMTARQVPIPGVQGKILDDTGTREMVTKLAGRETLSLSPDAQFAELKYLDPSAPSSYGLCRLGWKDQGAPPYEIEIAVIVENKQTFADFPPVTGGVCVFGSGKAAASRIASIGWVKKVPRVIYWGDMDTDGLDILASVRKCGIDCESVLMSLESFRRFERIGFSTSRTGGTIKVPATIAPDIKANLRKPEIELYRAIVENRTRYKRIEQEKIPYSEFFKETGIQNESE